MLTNERPVFSTNADFSPMQSSPPLGVNSSYSSPVTSNGSPISSPNGLQPMDISPNQPNSVFASSSVFQPSTSVFVASTSQPASVFQPTTSVFSTANSQANSMFAKPEAMDISPNRSILSEAMAAGGQIQPITPDMPITQPPRRELFPASPTIAAPTMPTTSVFSTASVIPTISNNTPSVFSTGSDIAPLLTGEPSAVFQQSDLDNFNVSAAYSVSDPADVRNNFTELFLGAGVSVGSLDQIKGFFEKYKMHQGLSNKCLLDSRYFWQVLFNYPGLVLEPLKIAIQISTDAKTSTHVLNRIMTCKINFNSSSLKESAGPVRLINVIISILDEFGTTISMHTNLIWVVVARKRIVRFEPLQDDIYTQYVDQALRAFLLGGTVGTQDNKITLTALLPGFSYRMLSCHPQQSDSIRCSSRGMCSAFVLKKAMSILVGLPDCPFSQDKDAEELKIMRFASAIETEYGTLPGQPDQEYGLFSRKNKNTVPLTAAAPMPKANSFANLGNPVKSQNYDMAKIKAFKNEKAINVGNALGGSFNSSLNNKARKLSGSK